MGFAAARGPGGTGNRIGGDACGSGPMNAPSDSSSLNRSQTHGALATRFADAGLDWVVPQWPAPSAVQGFVTTRNGGGWGDTLLPSTPPWVAPGGRRPNPFAPSPAAHTRPPRRGAARILAP